jgi:hypothetical protein
MLTNTAWFTFVPYSTTTPICIKDVSPIIIGISHSTVPIKCPIWNANNPQNLHINSAVYKLKNSIYTYDSDT